MQYQMHMLRHHHVREQLETMLGASTIEFFEEEPLSEVIGQAGKVAIASKGDKPRGPFVVVMSQFRDELSSYGYTYSVNNIPRNK